MREQQREAATTSVIEWLSHPNELGKAPSQIECVGEFERHEMVYFIFRYQENPLGDWLLAVCGGYESDSLEHCGHVFSEMQSYDPATAEENAVEMVESIRAYWMQQAKESEEQKGGAFISFVLLEECVWDREQYLAALKEQWDITIEEIADDPEESGEEESEDHVLSIVGSVNGMIVSVALMPGPVPNNEAEYNAETNYMWDDAVEMAQKHQAHLLVAVLPEENDHSTHLEAGKILVKLCDAAFTSGNVLGVNTAGTVLEPAFYHENALVMQEGLLPISNWVYLGLCLSENEERCGYTFGLDVFNKDNIEVINTAAEPVEVRDFLFNIVSYILSSDITLHDGETIGYSEAMKLPITRSPGCNIEGTTLKIGFKEA